MGQYLIALILSSVLRYLIPRLPENPRDPMVLTTCLLLHLWQHYHRAHHVVFARKLVQMSGRDIGGALARP